MSSGNFGSEALVQATHDLPFEEVAPRLAPWRLLSAVRERGGKEDEWRLAALILGGILRAEDSNVPDPRAILSSKASELVDRPFSISVEPLEDDQTLDLTEAFNPDQNLKRWHEASARAYACIKEAHKKGANLYLAEVQATDMVQVLRNAPEEVDLWLCGLAQGTLEFSRRVIRAEGIFRAICEALLLEDPERGAVLWRWLRANVQVRHRGRGGVEDLLHMLFRVSDSPAVEKLRHELLELPNCRSDHDLMNIALAATLNGHAKWLEAVISKDRLSTLAWRRQRGIVLEGFTSHNELPQPDAWPAGPVKTHWQDLRRKAARFRYFEACARHWWHAFWAASEVENAYAAWTLFLRSVDQRAWAWIGTEAQRPASRCEQMKTSHQEINFQDLMTKMASREGELKKQFLGMDIPEWMEPWRSSRH